MRRGLGRRLRTQGAGGSLARPAFDQYRRETDWAEYGAAPLLGVKGGCFIGHGRSNARAIRNAVKRAVEFCEADLHNRIRDKMVELHAQEEQLLKQNNDSGQPPDLSTGTTS